MGLTGGRMSKFVKKLAEVRHVLGNAAKTYVEEVVAGTYPDEAHSVH